MSTTHKTTAANAASKSTVSYSTRDEDGSKVIVRSDGKTDTDLATLKDGKLEYADKTARTKYHTQVARYLNDENIAFDGSVSLAGQGTDDTEGKSIPKAPKQTIEQGDKTPAYVEWVKKHKPKEFEARYGVRGEGKIEKTRRVTDVATGRPKDEAYTIDGVIADRKTHLTEKAGDNAVLADDQDDDQS
jgi:hypothetical protein